MKNKVPGAAKEELKENRNIFMDNYRETVSAYICP